MGDTKRPRSKTQRSPSSNSLKADRQRSQSKTEAQTPEVEPEPEPIENVLPWDIFNKEQLTELLSCTPTEMLPKLCKLLPSPNTHVNLKNSIKADLYLLLLHFSQQQHFSEEQTGALVTLYQHILNMVLEGKELMDLVLETSLLLTGKKELKPGMKLDFYTPEQVSNISEYFSKGVFQHFKLYRFSMLQEQEQTIISLEKIVNTCPPQGSFDPPPLAEAISDHDIETYLNAPPPESPRSEEEIEGEEGEQGTVEPAEEPNPLISMANVQTVLDTVGNDIMDKFTKDMKNKCTEKENQYMNRLSKVKKALD